MGEIIMNHINRFLKDDWARIPFSIIGVFLLIGSSVTTVYISQLEESKSEEISWTIETNEVENLIHYVEADLARILNYVACTSFDEVGKNPVIDPEPGTILYKKAFAGPGGISGTDINLNRVRYESYYHMKKMVEDNFQNNRYIQDDYNVTVSMPDSWEHIEIKDILKIEMNRGFDSIIKECETIYNVYPVFGINVSLSVYDLTQQRVVYEKKPVIMTIITNRFMLLEELTNEYNTRLDGTFGSLGINCLGTALVLTLIRGFTQHLTDKPSNIISTKWLEIITNGGILFEQGFVFNSVDPLGVVYTGYETTLAILNDLGVDTSTIEKSVAMVDQLQNPMGTKNMKEKYNEVLSNDEYNIDPKYLLDDDDLQFDVDANISLIAEDIANWILQDPDAVILPIIIDSYSADIYTKHTRKTYEHNSQSISNSFNNEYTNDQPERNRINEAEDLAKEMYKFMQLKCKICCGDGPWNFDKVTFNKMGKTEYTLSKTPWELEEDEKQYDFDFDNSNIPVILDGECVKTRRERDYNYKWKSYSTWTAVYKNESGKTCTFLFKIPEMSRSYTGRYYEKQWVNITFESNSFSNYKNTNNDIIKPFESTSFLARIDPNLEKVYTPNEQNVIDNYKTFIKWDDPINSPRNALLLNGEGIKYSHSYPTTIDEETYQYSHLMYPSWIYSEIEQVINYWKQTITEEIETNIQVNPETEASSIESNLTTDLLQLFTQKRTQLYNTQLQSMYRSAGKFNSVAAKVLYFVVTTYLDDIQSNLEHISGQNVLKDTIDKALANHGSSYDDMMSDTNNAKTLSASLPAQFPLGSIRPIYSTTGQNFPQGWTEYFQAAIVQKPSFLNVDSYKQYYGDSNETKCNISFRNFNVFSPGAELDSLLDKGFSAVNKQVTNALDTGFSKLLEIEESKRAEVKQALDEITNHVYQDLKNNLAQSIIDELEKSSPLKHLNVDITSLNIHTIVNQVLTNSKNQGNQQFSQDLNSTVLTDEIINKLNKKIDQDYGGDIAIAIKNAVSGQIESIYLQVFTQTVHHSQNILKDQYNTLSTKLQEWASDQLSDLVGKFIPAGLPLLPYIGWVITLNVWYIDVSGEIPYFQVVDTYDETNPDPFWGHSAQEYVRRHDKIFMLIDDTGIPKLIGINTPVSFDYSTVTIAIVPPNKLTGMGDRVGGWDEISEYP
jgi:hypothetical protein